MTFKSTSARWLLAWALCVSAVRAQEVTIDVQATGDDEVSVSWESVSGATYFFSFSSTLSPPAWLAPEGPISGDGSTLSRSFNVAGTRRGFFHVSFTEQPFTLLGDFDNDGIPTSWEIAHAHDPLDPGSAALDHDLDGLHALAEFRAGSEPQQANPEGRSYLYDGKGQLVRAVHPGGRAIVYDYDAVGNLVSVSVESP